VTRSEYDHAKDKKRKVEHNVLGESANAKRTKSHGTTPTKIATNVTAQISPRTAERMTTSHWARMTTGDRTRVIGALKAGTPAVKEGIMKDARGERLELGVGDGVYELGD
jgi:hypothetical protein